MSKAEIIIEAASGRDENYRLVLMEFDDNGCKFITDIVEIIKASSAADFLEHWVLDCGAKYEWPTDVNYGRAKLTRTKFIKVLEQKY